MNFTAAVTQIRNLANERETILQNIANAIAEAIIDRQKNQGLSGSHKSATIKDITNILESFSSEEREKILTLALVTVASNGKFGAGSNKKSYSDDDDFSDMFKNRKRF